MKKHVAKRALRAPLAYMVRAVGCISLLWAGACGSSSAGTGAVAAATTTVATVSLAATTNANTSATLDDNQTLGMQHVLPLLHFVPREAAMGQHCDPNATITHTQVCGEGVPGAEQATWSACAPDRGAHQGPHHAWLSSGSVVVTASVTPDGNTACDANTAVVNRRQSQFTIRMGDANGPTRVLSGNNTETMIRVATHASNDNVTLDVNSTMVDAGGNVFGSTVITGSIQLAADPNATDPNAASCGPGDAHAMSFGAMDPNAAGPDGMWHGGHRGHDGPHGPFGHHPGMDPHLVSGSLTVNGDAVVLTALAHHGACMWPTSGSVQRTNSAGVRHTLMFGAPCGSATLDGTAVTLPNHPPGHHPGAGPPGQRPTP